MSIFIVFENLPSVGTVFIFIYAKTITFQACPWLEWMHVINDNIEKLTKNIYRYIAMLPLAYIRIFLYCQTIKSVLNWSIVKMTDTMLKLTKSSDLCGGGQRHIFKGVNSTSFNLNDEIKIFRQTYPPEDFQRCTQFCALCAMELSNMVHSGAAHASHVTGRRARTKKAKATKIENHAGDRNWTGQKLNDGWIREITEIHQKSIVHHTGSQLGTPSNNGCFHKSIDYHNQKTTKTGRSKTNCEHF